MKRILAAAAALIMILMLSCVPAYAEAGRLSLAYVPPTERGTLFYLDISYDGAVSAALLELSFDSSLAEFREVKAVADTTRVKAQSDGGTVKIVLGDTDRVSGKLCRLGFKTIGSGSINFILRMTEGVDGDLHYIDSPPECSLKVSLSLGSSAVSGNSSGKSYRGSESNKSGSKTADPDSATDDEEARARVRDLRSPDRNNTTPIILGVAAGTAAFLLVIFGFIIGRRSHKKKTPAEKNGGEEEPK